MNAAPSRATATRDGKIVLVGGGHAHLYVLAQLARRPTCDVTLVSDHRHALYSGMVPGLIAGRYRIGEARIDLPALCAATGARFIEATACGVDRAARRLLLEGQPAITYDLLSLNIGITSALDDIEGAREHAIPLKPITGLHERFQAVLEAATRPLGPRRFAMIGGGAAGVEVILAIRTRLLQLARSASEEFSFLLVTDGELLASHHPKLRLRMRHRLAERGIFLIEQARVTAMGAGWLELADGRRLPANAMLLAGDPAPPHWFTELGLPLDARGFLAVGRDLCSPGDARIFAAGDCAGLLADPRPKAGVYAVRAGPPLARNLRRAALGKTLLPWFPQREALALIGIDRDRAVAVRGGLVLEGGWVARWKEWLDRRWVRNYQALAASRPGSSWISGTTAL